ncbi:MAG TPA: phosphoenolpyruvate synthase regulatory protein, partial [Rhizorhapis sp.]|nr:phosphoenolpyruvate synthase regulatory protein [Rhizorhapis sp.]
MLYPQPVHKDAAMTRLHLHLLSDSTGETLENIAKAAIA